MRSPLRMRRPSRRRVAALISVPVALAATFTATQFANAKEDLGAAQTDLKVMTWNIHGKSADIPAMAELVDAHDTDVLTVQEIQRADEDQVKKLADELGWYTTEMSDHTHFSRGDHPGPCDEPESGWAGNAVLSRYPIAERVTIPLSPEDQDCPVKRVMAGVNLDLPNSQNIRVFTSHFTAGESRKATKYRQEQALKVLNYLDHDGPLLFTGDVNARPEGTIPGWFDERGWFDTGGAYADEPTRIGGGRIDYIFSKAVRVNGGYVVDSTLSDHRPLVMNMQVS